MLTVNWELLMTATPRDKAARFAATARGEDWSHADRLLHKEFSNEPRLVKTRSPQKMENKTPQKT